MPLYDLRCPECDVTFENWVGSYDEMKATVCPVCDTSLDNVPTMFKFDVVDSNRAQRQKLERRFKRREAKINRTMDQAAQEKLENWCRKHQCRRSY